MFDKAMRDVFAALQIVVAAFFRTLKETETRSCHGAHGSHRLGRITDTTHSRIPVLDLRGFGLTCSPTAGKGLVTDPFHLKVQWGQGIQEGRG
jgi:hypothetical protein